MRPMKYLKALLVVVHYLLIVNCAQGYALPFMPASSDIISASEVTKVLNDINERMRLYHLLDQEDFKIPLRVPSCPEGQIYDPIEKVCGGAYNQEHCGDHMIFLPVPNTEDLGACACSNMDSLKRWGQPQVLLGHNQCADIGTKGPCNVGEAIVAKTKFHAECGVDACIQTRPENAINFSDGPRLDSFLYPAFNFTYKGKCFTTESQGFCKRGRVMRFILPYKIPACVDRNEVELPPRNQFLGSGGSSVQQPALRECEPGTVVNPTTGICQTTSLFEFD